MKLDKILVRFMTNISNLFLAQYWRLETSFRPFYDFIKIKIYWDMAIFNIWHLSFFLLPYSPFHKNKTLEYTWHNWLLTLMSNWIRFLNWKGPSLDLSPVLQIVQTFPENYCPCLYLSIGHVWLLNFCILCSYFLLTDQWRIILFC